MAKVRYIGPEDGGVVVGDRIVYPGDVVDVTDEVAFGRPRKVQKPRKVGEQELVIDAGVSGLLVQTDHFELVGGVPPESGDGLEALTVKELRARAGDAGAGMKKADLIALLRESAG